MNDDRKTRKADPEDALNTTGNYGIYKGDSGAVTLYNRDSPDYKRNSKITGNEPSRAILTGLDSTMRALNGVLRKYK
jgi:hypothetical protein